MLGDFGGAGVLPNPHDETPKAYTGRDHEENLRGSDATGWRPEREGNLPEVGSQSADLPSMAIGIRWGEGGDGQTTQGTGEEQPLLGRQPLALRWHDFLHTFRRDHFHQMTLPTRPLHKERLPRFSTPQNPHRRIQSQPTLLLLRPMTIKTMLLQNRPDIAHKIHRNPRH